MFKNVLRIAVQEAFPPRTRGRPALVGFDDAYDDILRVVRTGMQWRYLRPTAAVAYITVFKTIKSTNTPLDCLDTSVLCLEFLNIGRRRSQRRRVSTFLKLGGDDLKTVLSHV